MYIISSIRLGSGEGEGEGSQTHLVASICGIMISPVQSVQSVPKAHCEYAEPTPPSSQELSLLNLHVSSHRTPGTTVIASGLGEGNTPSEGHSAPCDEYGSGPMALINGRRGGAGDAELVAILSCVTAAAQTP